MKRCICRPTSARWRERDRRMGGTGWRWVSCATGPQQCPVRQQGKGGERLRDALQGELILLIKAASSQGLDNLFCCRLFTAVEFNTPMNKAPQSRERQSGLLTLLHGTRGFQHEFDISMQWSHRLPQLHQISAPCGQHPSHAHTWQKVNLKAIQTPGWGEHLFIKKTGWSVSLGGRAQAGLGAVLSVRWCCISTLR